MADRRTTSLALLLAAAPLFGHALPAASGLVVDDQDRVVIPNSAHRKLVNLEPVRAVAPETPLERMILVLKLSPEASSNLKQLLKDQQDPTSASYHQWLTPDDFGKRFGPTQAQRDAATLWLLQQGFSLHGLARSGTSITFSGTAGQVGKAFRTAIMEYRVNGVTHHGNATNLSLPRGLAGFVSGVATMHDLFRTPRSSFLRKAAVKPQATDGNGNSYVGPGDFATIYDLNPLFNNGITGKDVTIGVVGQTDVALSDFTGFRQLFGLTGGSFNTIYTGADPGLVPTDQPEASIDTEWASAAAPGADIRLVTSPSSLVSEGVDLSALYLVDNNIAPIITMSYGECEADMGGQGSTYVTFYEQLWAQAAGQGISVFVAAGDSGAAGCDDPDEYAATQGLAVSGMASTPYNTCVGGTMLSSGSTYWSGGTTQTTQTTAKAYAPGLETAWDETSNNNGFRLFAGGGGASAIWSQPAWQSATGTTNKMRDVPDVSLNASAIYSPSAVMLDGSLQEYGGTSVAAPCMAGIMALVVQQHGRQGNPNPTLYSLGSAQYGSNGPVVFHDITSGTNSVPGLTGYLAGVGYDQATGLGSVDATLLVNNWTAGTNPIQVTVTTPASAVTIASGQSVTFGGSATDASGAITSYFWSFGDGNPIPSQSATDTPSATATHTYAIGNTTQVYTAYLVASDGLHVQSSSPVTVTVTPTGVNPVITEPVTTSFAFPGATITFAASATTQNAGQIQSYSWDFGDGTTASGNPVTHVFAENNTGYFTPVTVTAKDSTQATGTATVQVLSDSSYIMDLNGDNSIDVRDLLTLAMAWSTTAATSTQFNGLQVWGDLNADGIVNDVDLNLWLSNFTPVAP